MDEKKLMGRNSIQTFIHIPLLITWILGWKANDNFTHNRIRRQYLPEHLGTGLTSLTLEDMFHQVLLVLELITLGLKVESVVPKNYNLFYEKMKLNETVLVDWVLFDLHTIRLVILKTCFNSYNAKCEHHRVCTKARYYIIS